MSLPVGIIDRLATGKVAEMSCIISLLDAIAPEIESQLKPRLSGTQRSLIVEFIPQVWVFETEDQTVSIIADRQGNVFTQALNRNDRDVTIRWKHDYLASVLRTRSTAYVPHGEIPTILLHTEKGRAAFNFLKNRLGMRDRPDLLR